MQWRRRGDGQRVSKPGATSLEKLRVEPAERSAQEEGYEEDQRRELERSAERYPVESLKVGRG